MAMDFRALRSKIATSVKLSVALRLLVGGLALWCVVWSAQLFIAGNAYYNVKNSISLWQKKPELASIESIDRALDKIATALNYFPKNALYYQIQGQLYEWKAYSESESATVESMQTIKENESRKLSHAAASYEKSLALRPNWSGSWIGLASIKWKLNELDETFYTYLNRAINVGPQDAIVHKFVAEYGLAMFSARSVHYVKIQSRLKRHLDLGIQNPLSRDFVLNTIQKQNANATVCRWLKASSYPVRKRIPNCVSYD
ncbi:VpsP family polysaccharide biosynthesis protein [Alteromonas gracilis]|uniref:VpsP family polysaccharide biosynthesis protein n=1 Tax=Alteromonas gracilis TaxID=1479524 RepID=UPI0037369E2C